MIYLQAAALIVGIVTYRLLKAWWVRRHHPERDV